MGDDSAASNNPADSIVANVIRERQARGEMGGLCVVFDGWGMKKGSLWQSMRLMRGKNGDYFCHDWE